MARISVLRHQFCECGTVTGLRGTHELLASSGMQLLKTLLLTAGSLNPLLETAHAIVDKPESAAAAHATVPMATATARPTAHLINESFIPRKTKSVKGKLHGIANGSAPEMRAMSREVA